MKIGMIGLGRMGGNMGTRLLMNGHDLVAYDPDYTAAEALAQAGASTTDSLAELIGNLNAPRIVWVMVPSGESTEETIHALGNNLSNGDIVVDGGNSNYKDSMRRAESLRGKGIYLLDVGTSGGIWGLENGYSIMVGGDHSAFLKIEPLLHSLAPPNGYGHVGPSGAGHFVKMIHNGIEYGLMQSYAEGFELLSSKEDFPLDLAQIASIWMHGSVVRSWLLELTLACLKDNPSLKGIADFVEDSGEGRWTVQEGLDLAIPTPVIALALQARFRSRQDESFGGKLLSAMRNKFGGHSVKHT